MFPKIIWHYWEQGWDNAPFVVQECLKSLKHYAPDWEIINLDKKSLNNYIDLPSKIFKIEDFPIQPISDLIRILLLKKYGGVWIDATTYLNVNLTNFLYNIECDFFCFWRWSNKTTMSTWFMAAKEDSCIAKIMSEEFTNYLTSDDFINNNKKYFKKWRGSPNYYVFHKLFEQLSHKNLIFMKKIQEMPFIDSTPMLQSVFSGWNKDVPLEIAINVFNNLPMVKLSHSIGINEFNKNSVLGLLMKKMNGNINKNESHIHICSGLRTTLVFNSFINKPEKIAKYAGQFESESDLKLCNEKFSHYHVYNFSSIDYKNGSQLLIPYGANRIFIRYQIDDRFSSPRELAYKDEIEALKKEIINLKNTIFWEKFINKIINNLDNDIFTKYDLTKNNIQFFIEGIDHSVYYELLKKEDQLYFCIHCDNEILLNEKFEQFKRISEILDSEINILHNCIYK